MAWNASGNANRSAGSTAPTNKNALTRMRVLVVGTIVVLAVAAGLVFLLSSKKPEPELNTGRKSTAIKEVKPDVRQTDSDSHADKLRKIKLELNEQVKEFVKKANTNNVIRLGPPQLDPDDPDNALRTQTMTEVAMLIGIEPGEPMPPVPFSFMMDDDVMEQAEISGERVVTLDGGNKRFKEELAKWKITPKETDSEARLKRKQELLGIQLELMNGIDEGISVYDSIRAAWEYRKNAYEARNELISALTEIHEADPDISTTRELIKSANEKLSADGIKSISIVDVVQDYDSDSEEQSNE